MMCIWSNDWSALTHANCSNIQTVQSQERSSHQYEWLCLCRFETTMWRSGVRRT